MEVCGCGVLKHCPYSQMLELLSNETLFRVDRFLEGKLIPHLQFWRIRKPSKQTQDKDRTHIVYCLFVRLNLPLWRRRPSILPDNKASHLHDSHRGHMNSHTWSHQFPAGVEENREGEIFRITVLGTGLEPSCSKRSANATDKVTKFSLVWVRCMS